MPQSPFIIATKTPSADVLIFDYSKHPSRLGKLTVTLRGGLFSKPSPANNQYPPPPCGGQLCTVHVITIGQEESSTECPSCFGLLNVPQYV